MLARQSPLPFSLTRIALFKAFLSAAVVHFTARFEPFALFFALVILVLWILLLMATKRAIVPAFETDVTGQRTASFSGIFSAFNYGQVVAKWQDTFFRDAAFNFRWIDVALHHRFMTAFELTLHPNVASTARHKTLIFAGMAVFTDDLFTRLWTFVSIHFFTAFHLGNVLAVGEDFFYSDVTEDVLGRAEAIDHFLK